MKARRHKEKVGAFISSINQQNYFSKWNQEHVLKLHKHLKQIYLKEPSCLLTL